MEFIEPIKTGFTIYSKSGCPNCLTTKNLLKENNLFFKQVNCDDYLLENKEEFLTFIENIAETSYRTFPMVFYDGKFIGGAKTTKEYIEKILSFEDNF
jgi:glutaredoxin